MITFRGSCGHEVRVDESLAGRLVRCPHCHGVLRAPETLPPEPIPYAQPVLTGPPVRRAQSRALTVTYLVSLALGIGVAGYVYVVAFNRLDEDTLVRLTPVWAFPIVFGFYGYVSQRLVRYLDEGRVTSLYDAARYVIATTGRWSIVALVPFLFLRWRSSLLVTSVAAVCLAGFLWFFFAVVFPGL